jgi:hypothetical protein
MKPDRSMPPTPGSADDRTLGVAVADALALARDASPPFLFNHAVRTHAWAVELARLDGIEHDPEVLHVGALLHDLGLTERFDGPRCFENESAAAAADFARKHGWDDLRSESLANAIRLHAHPRVIPEDGAEGYLLSEATSCDVRGYRLAELPRATVDSVIARFPRLDFADGFIALIEAQARAKPGCLADLYLQRGLADRIRAAPFVE